MFKRLIPASLAAVVLLSSSLSAQVWKGTGRLEGQLTDKAGKPLANADVKLRLPRAGKLGPDLKTDKSGRWTYLGLAGGEWHIEFSADGYIPGKVILEVDSVKRAPIVKYALDPVPPPTAAEPAAETTGLPPEVVAAVKKGNDALAAKNYPEARAAFEKASAAITDNVGLYCALARAYDGEGNRAKAIETLMKVTEKEPGNVGAWLLVSNMKLEQGDLEGGRAALEKVPPESIKDPAVYTNIGILFLNKNKPADAETYFTKAIEVAPGDADGYHMRGLVRLQQRKNAEAKADLTKFLELAPTSPAAEEVKQLLSAIK